MSRATDEINKVTGTVIGLSLKLIIIAVVILLLIQCAGRGYSFGYEVFAPQPVESAPGHDITVTVTPGESDLDVLKSMKESGLIRNSYAALVSDIFFDYTIYPGTYILNTSMTSREMLEEMNVKPEGYVEETAAQPEEETEEAVIMTQAAAETEAVMYNEEPSEMVWEAVEAEIEPETVNIQDEEADEDIILIQPE